MHAEQLPQVALRHCSPYGAREKVSRVAWAVVYSIFFRWSPRPCWRWRNWLLRVFGARVSSTARIHPTVTIVIPWQLEVGANTSIGDSAILYALGRIRLGDRVTVSQYAHLCAGTHDYQQPHMPLIRPGVTVGADAWVAADAFVGPGVTIGDGAVVGARAVLTKDVAPWTVVAGNPATFLKMRNRTGEH